MTQILVATLYMVGCAPLRKRERERERETDRQTDRQRVNDVVFTDESFTDDGVALQSCHD